MEKIRIGYVDDDIDVFLSNYLSSISKNNDYIYEDIRVEKEDTYDSLLKKIILMRCQIVVLDSKLYNDSCVKHKLSGQELELILADKLPFIFSIVISQNDDKDNYQYIKKYISTVKVNNISESLKYYNSNLEPLLIFAASKCMRHHLCFERELSSNGAVNKMTIDNIKSSLDGKGRVMLSREDIDLIIEKLGEIQEYESK